MKYRFERHRNGAKIGTVVRHRLSGVIMRVGDTGVLKRLEAIALEAAREHGSDFNRVTEAMRQAVEHMPDDDRLVLKDTISIVTDGRGHPTGPGRRLKS
jgi:hypothetical protein